MRIVINLGAGLYCFTRWVSTALIACGVAAVLAYAWTRLEETLYQRAQSTYLAELPPAAAMTAGDEFISRAAPARDVASDALLIGTRTLQSQLLRRWTAPDPKVIGRLVIRNLGIDAVIREGADDVTLRRAVGHLPATALPGSAGNLVLTGHRDTFFRPLLNIRNQDEILAITTSGVHKYLVYEISVVSPDHTDVLRKTSQPECTLVTCFPFDYIGSAPRRFIVRARLSIAGTPSP